MVTLDDAAEELYAAHPTEFVNRREALTKQARAAGDRSLANQIKGLRRPTVSAWVLNVVAHKHVGPLDELLNLGGQLRTAQAMLDAAEIKRLTARRQVLEREVVTAAVALFEDMGEDVGPSAVTEIEGTLRASVADPAAADAVASGRLTRALSYAGFGEVDLTAATATPVAPRLGKDAEPTSPSGSPKSAAADPDDGNDAGPKAQVLDLAGRRKTSSKAGSQRMESETTDESMVDADGESDDADDEELLAAQQALEEAQRRVALAAARRDLANARKTIRTATLRAEKALKARDYAAGTVADLESQLESARTRLESATTEAADAASELEKAQRVAQSAEDSGAEI